MYCFCLCYDVCLHKLRLLATLTLTETTKICSQSKIIASKRGAEIFAT